MVNHQGQEDASRYQHQVLRPEQALPVVVATTLLADHPPLSSLTPEPFPGLPFILKILPGLKIPGQLF